MAGETAHYVKLFSIIHYINENQMKSEVKCDLLSPQMQQHLHGCFRPTQDVHTVRGQAH